MRRWAWRGALGVVVVAVMLATVVGVQAFNRACDGSLEGLRYLARVRSQLAAATAPPPTPPPPAPVSAPGQPPVPPVQAAPTPAPPSAVQQVYGRVLGVVGVTGDAALRTVVRVKQDDRIAYPAHTVAAHTLNVAGCGKDAVRIQWLKAGLHASQDGQPERIARALEASSSDPADLADLRQVVRTWTERASQSVSLRQVLHALEARS
jgi:hypothetical protein